MILLMYLWLSKFYLNELWLLSGRIPRYLQFVTMNCLIVMLVKYVYHKYDTLYLINLTYYDFTRLKL